MISIEVSIVPWFRPAESGWPSTTPSHVLARSIIVVGRRAEIGRESRRPGPRFPRPLPRITMSMGKRTLGIALIAIAGWAASVGAAGPDPSPGMSRYRPDPVSVQRYGSGYRYPQAGWNVLHIEGEPYERGYQHGRLMAPEIAQFIHELARYRSTRAPADAWRYLRLVANALFLRRGGAGCLAGMEGSAPGGPAGRGPLHRP